MTAFAYNAAHQRGRKSGPAGTTVTLGGLYERRSISGSVTHIFYVHGPEGPIAQAVYAEGTGTTAIQYVHTDGLGSIGALTTETGTVLEAFDYEPFGGRQDAAGNPVTGSSKDVRVGFTGHWHDDDLGLIPNMASRSVPALHVDMSSNSSTSLLSRPCERRSYETHQRLFGGNPRGAGVCRLVPRARAA